MKAKQATRPSAPPDPDPDPGDDDDDGDESVQAVTAAAAAAVALPDNQQGRQYDIADPLPNVIPGGGVSMLIGPSLVGKTALLAGMIARLLAGKTVFGVQGANVPVVAVIVTDRRHRHAKEWYERAGVKEGPRFKMYCLSDDLSINWKKFRSDDYKFQMLRKHLENLKLPPGSLVFIDPFPPYLTKNLNDYSSVAASLGPINQLLARMGITVVGIMHTFKQKQEKGERVVRAHEKALGSVALGAYSYSQIILTGPDETGADYYLVDVLSHSARSVQWRFDRDDEGLFINGALLDSAEEKAAKKAKEEDDDTIVDTPNVEFSPGKKMKIDLILSFIPEYGKGYIDPKTLVEKTAALGANKKIPLDTMNKYLKELRAMRIIEKLSHGSYHKLPIKLEES